MDIIPGRYYNHCQFVQMSSNLIQIIMVPRVGAVIRSRVESTGHEVSMWDPKVLNFPLLQQPIQMIMDKVL